MGRVYNKSMMDQNPDIAGIGVSLPLATPILIIVTSHLAGICSLYLEYCNTCSYHDLLLSSSRSQR